MMTRKATKGRLDRSEGPAGQPLKLHLTPSRLGRACKFRSALAPRS